MKNFILILFVSLFGVNVYSQDSLKLNVNGDIVNRFTFRGIDVSNAPAIQPVVTLSKGNLTVGCWGTFSILPDRVNDSFYNEVDIFANYKLGNFTFGITDYFIPTLEYELPSLLPYKKYFKYGKDSYHRIESSIQYRGNKIPFWITGAVFLYGHDLNENNKQNFSSYFEAGYSFVKGNNTLDIFIGGIFYKGFYYGTKPGIINIGISETLEISGFPVKIALSVNPQTPQVFTVFGITI